MGDLIGGIIGGIGSLIGGDQAAQGEKAGAQQALTGYNYLTGNNAINTAQTNGAAASNGWAGTTGAINQLLTSNGQNNPAFQNYLNSTGYNFQLSQGLGAISGNAASKGILDSGDTARALQGYGQGLASTTFNNYLTQLGGLGAMQGQQAQQGVNAATAVGQAGTTGGGNAGNLTAQAGQSTGTSIANAFNGVGGAVQNGMNNGSLNFFGSPASAPVVLGASNGGAAGATVGNMFG